MTAGAGAAFYEALPPPLAPPAPKPRPAEVLEIRMRRPEMPEPGEYLLGLSQMGLITTNDARMLMGSWAEIHALPSMIIHPRQL